VRHLQSLPLPTGLRLANGRSADSFRYAGNFIVSIRRGK
jgi:hypothetical protein